MKWLLPTALLAIFVYVRSRTRLSLFKSLVADLTMTVLLPVAATLSIIAWFCVRAIPQAIRNIPEDLSAGPVGLILVLLASTLISTAFQSAVLRAFRYGETMTGFWLLALLNLFCLGAAAYRTISLALAARYVG